MQSLDEPETGATYYVIDKKRELKRKQECRFGILAITEISEGLFEVKSDSKQIYYVGYDDALKTLTCTCPHGTYEVASAYVDESKRCRHINAVRSIDAEEEQIQRIREAAKLRTQDTIKKGYLKEDSE